MTPTLFNTRITELSPTVGSEIRGPETINLFRPQQAARTARLALKYMLEVVGR
jgi:hypothetical protein